MAEPPTDFLRFVSEVALRLEAGRESYGDHSFACAPSELLGEIEEELLDVAGWSFILWCRLQALSPRLQTPPPPRPSPDLETP
jgi:hypothetical protein